MPTGLISKAYSQEEKKKSNRITLKNALAILLVLTKGKSGILLDGTQISNIGYIIPRTSERYKAMRACKPDVVN